MCYKNIVLDFLKLVPVHISGTRKELGTVKKPEARFTKIPHLNSCETMLANYTRNSY